MPWQYVVLGLSVIVLGASAFGLIARRSKAPETRPAPRAREHRDAAPRATAPGAAPPDPAGAAPAPAPAGAAPMPMPKAAATMNWNAIGAITGVLGLVVSVIGLFKG